MINNSMYNYFLFMLNPFIYFRQIFYMLTYKSTKYYIGDNQKLNTPETIVTWYINNLNIEFVIEKLKILDVDIVHLQGVYKNKEKLIDSLKDIYYNIATNDKKQYYIYNDCGLVVLSKCYIDNFNFYSYGYWNSKINSGYIFYNIGGLNFCNCCIDSDNIESNLTKLQIIMKKKSL